MCLEEEQQEHKPRSNNTKLKSKNHKPRNANTNPATDLPCQPSTKATNTDPKISKNTNTNPVISIFEKPNKPKSKHKPKSKPDNYKSIADCYWN